MSNKYTIIKSKNGKSKKVVVKGVKKVLYKKDGSRKMYVVSKGKMMQLTKYKEMKKKQKQKQKQKSKNTQKKSKLNKKKSLKSKRGGWTRVDQNTEHLAIKVLNSNYIYEGSRDFEVLKEVLVIAMNKSALLKHIISDEYYDTMSGQPNPQNNTNTVKHVKDELRSIDDMYAKGRVPFYNKEFVKDFINQVSELFKSENIRNLSPIKQISEGIIASKSEVHRISAEAHKIIKDIEQYSYGVSRRDTGLFSRARRTLSRFKPF